MYTLVVYRPYDSNLYSGIAVSLLMIGLGLEILGTQFNITNSTSWVAYLLAVVNAFIRLFILIQTKCNTAATTVGELTKEIVKIAKDTGRPVSDVAKAVSSPLGTIDADNIYKNSMNILNDALVKRPESKEEQAVFRTKLKELFGRGESKPIGGRRR